MSGLQVRGLEVVRGSFKVTLDDLHVRPGTVTGLVGRSGSGKSTLLDALSGFLPSVGKILVDGREVQDLPAEKRRIALLFQRPSLFTHLNLVQNVAFGLRVQGVEKKDHLERAAGWLSRVGLSGFETRFGHELSEGQAQRVAFARALIVGFPVILLDEPFSALDPQTRTETRKLLKELVEQTQVAALLVSHFPEDVEALATQVLLQENGKTTLSLAGRY